jgi:probable F420-dependent oxidoreductase
MKLGMHLPQMGPHATRTANLTYAQRVEALGYNSIWVSDHVIIPYQIASRYPASADGSFPVSPQTDFLEPLVLLGAIAACTERVQMGLSVMVLPHRHAVLTAKMLASLDRLSEGRLLVGTGVGWMQEELEALNMPYHQRGALSDEYLEAMIKLWTEERPSYQGTFVNFPPIGCHPRPVQQPHPPLLIGGHSPAALRRVARFGQGWHSLNHSPEVLTQDLQTIHQEMRLVGRDPAELEVSLRLMLYLTDEPQPSPRSYMHGNAPQIIDDIRTYERVGIHHLVLFFPMGRRVDPIAFIERFANQVLPAFR